MFLGSMHTLFASEEQKSRIVFDVNNQAFKASEPWDPTKSAIITGAAIGLPGVGILLNAVVPADNTIAVVVLASATFAALVMRARQKNYQDVYNKAGGLTVYGAAAANNVSGTQAWVKHQGKEILLKKDAEGKIPLIYASGNGATDTVRSILKDMPEQEKTLVHSTRLPFLLEFFLPGSYVYTETYQTINPVNKQDDKGRTALHYAAEGKHLETMRLLYKDGANIYAKDKDGITLRQLARSNNHVVQKFLTEVKKSR